ncbi:MAG: class I SAM-dependent rRNA methyltransferase, partial [Bacteroidia bacterium]|nr:class I SAM-dependent rRNA methyltransferase [Bacteroidia bacterium]
MYNFSIEEITPQNLAVKLSVKGERSVRAKHPWIFSDSIEKINKKGKAGDLCIIFSHTKNKPIGVGLYDPGSPIRVKMLHYGSGATIDYQFFHRKIQEAFVLRNELLKTDTNSYRIVFGENDGFPGLIADMYAQVLVVKLYSEIWFPYLDSILRSLLELTGCTAIVIRLSRNLQKTETHSLKDGMLLYGSLDDEMVRFKEHGIQFMANVVKGHKTGYFLDHRANRKRVGELAPDKRVLDVFSYTGGFSVHALANGAKEVTSVDVSEHALKLAKSNAKLNSHTGEHYVIAGDAFLVLKQLYSEGKQYDLVIIDPPSFAKSQKETVIARKKYAELAELGAKLTGNQGILVLASCSSRIVADDFFRINTESLKKSGRSFR